ncbi:hypothetical protein D9619_001158 [Psilocybe cf. subviscida]|uniref:HMG box domain-containing protein n=1 Tax=Psilocybe cf. subviscida TaxID=2480587 RepID=A0A8H5BHP9_9AGAR|nr:hypothetical protein D9619_001158 [Psilocybe cf. subviscida]
MPDQVSTFESHRAQLAASLNAVADSMRNCAQMADTFAKVVSDSTYSPETAEMLQGALDGFTKGKRKAALSPEDEDGPKKRKRNTKPKDPHAPKRPASSYIIFQNQVRKTLKDTHPSLSNPELLQMISDQWKSMTPEQKEASRPYNQQMRDAKEVYTDSKKAYENRSPEEIEAANAAAAAEAMLKKANAKPRGPRKAKAVAVDAAAAADAVAKARPPPTADQMASTDSSDEDSEEEDTAEPDQVADSSDHDMDEDEEEDSPEPAPKKRRSPSAQPKEKEHKKKSSKA